MGHGAVAVRDRPSSLPRRSRVRPPRLRGPGTVQILTLLASILSALNIIVYYAFLIAVPSGTAAAQAAQAGAGLRGVRRPRPRFVPRCSQRELSPVVRPGNHGGHSWRLHRFDLRGWL